MIKLLQTLAIVILTFSSFSGLGQNAQDRLEIVLSEQGISAANNGWHITSEHISTTSKIHHIYYQQIKGGVLIKGTESSVHISQKGDVLSQNNFFVDNVDQLQSTPKEQLIAPKDAVKSVVTALGYVPMADFFLKNTPSNSLNRNTFSDGGVAARDITTTLLYAQDAANQYHLVWEVSLLAEDYKEWLIITVDAVTGAVLGTKDIMQQCATGLETLEPVTDFNKNLVEPMELASDSETESICEVCYEVFQMPLVSPLEGDRSIVQNPADPIASPYGWHDTNGQPGADTVYTEGNNVSVVEKGDNHGYQTNGGQQLDFTGYMFNPVFTIENQYEDAALTSVFYWSNVIHDITYRLGFDESSGSLQKLNYYSSGRSNSDFDARIQARIGCNAFFASNGDRPIMILGYCDDKDSAFDSTVIAHEYGHGIVNELIGGAGASDCLNNHEQMTEGWADYLGVLLTMKPEDVGADRRTIGNYYFGQGINGRGIRRYPYSTDMSVNPQTYDHIKTSAIPHGVGSVWAATIWEMTWALIDVYGFDENLYNFTGDINQDAGNIMALALVLEGMKLMKCNPGFIDGRDAILQAAASIYGFESQCVIFNAFAKRGLGLNADQGDSESKLDGVQDFEEYPVTAQLKDFPILCNSEEIITDLSGGLPLGGIYSGIGIIDDGNGRTFSVDTSITGSGAIEVTYEVQEGLCAIASSTQNDLVIELDEVPPVMVCPFSYEDTVVVGDTYILPNYVPDVIAWDFCTDDLIIVQNPPKFSELSEGRHPISMTISDEAGNIAACTFFLNLVSVGNESLDFLTSLLLYPVPGDTEITIYNPTKKKILTVLMRDINGRLIKSINPDSKTLRIPIDITQFSAGTYFLTIVGEGDTTVRRMTKL